MGTLLTYSLVTLISIVSNTVQTITGFAGVMLAMPLTIKLIGAEDARFVLNVIVILNCIMVVMPNRSHINRRELFKIVAIMAGGCAAGIVMFKICPLDFLLVIYGVFIIAVALKKLFGKSAKKLPPVIENILVVFAGLFQGMFLSGGSLLVVYATEKMKDKAEFRATVSSVWIILNSVMLLMDVIGTKISTRAIHLTLINIVGLLFAVYLGNTLYKKINQQTFMKITYVLLLISGIFACV